MNQNQANSITCSYCDESFLSKGKYQSHYIQKHQNEIRIDQNTTVFRTEGGKFVCLCGKEFELGQSLKRHYKTCVNVHERGLEDQDGTMLSSI
jgi:uncharacterized Zn-finger protein